MLTVDCNSALRALVNPAVLMGLCITACAAHAQIAVVDDLGESLTLAAPATRIVSLAPHITELLFAAGAGSRLVGVVSHSDYPPAALQVRQLGSYTSVSHEALVALQPDLVVAWHSGNGGEIIRRLRALGLTVYVNEPRALPDIARSLRDLGALSGHAIAGNAAADAFMQRYVTLAERYQGRTKVSVFYQVWDQPLVTVNGKHLISAVMRLCGGENVFSDALVLAPQINVESVVRANPQVIIASGMGEARPDWLNMWEAWPSIAAVRNRQLYFVPPDLLQRHTPRVLDGAATVCEQLQQARQSGN